MIRKKMVEGIFGIKMPETLARELAGVEKSLPKECRRLVRKSSVPNSTELVPGERADISMVSVESVDRDGEIVLAKGMDLTTFQRNSIVTFAHKYDELPIGKAQWIKKVEGGIKAKTLYSQKPKGWEGNWLPDAVFSMVQEGILRGKSVGFLPRKIHSVTQAELAANPTWEKAHAVIEEASLIEYAIAPVPVNQDALVEAVAKGFATGEVLRKLGLTLPKKKAIPKKPIDLVALLAKQLEAIKIDPVKIVAKLKEKYGA